MMGVFAEFERSIIQERVRAGLWSQTTFSKTHSAQQLDRSQQDVTGIGT